MNADKVVKDLRTMSTVMPHLSVMTKAADLIESLQTKLAKAQRRERAAVADMGRFMCRVCAHESDGEYCRECKTYAESKRSNFEWRGDAEEDAE